MIRLNCAAFPMIAPMHKKEHEERDLQAGEPLAHVAFVVPELRVPPGGELWKEEEAPAECSGVLIEHGGQCLD